MKNFAKSFVKSCVQCKQPGGTREGEYLKRYTTITWARFSSQASETNTYNTVLVDAFTK